MFYILMSYVLCIFIIFYGSYVLVCMHSKTNLPFGHNKVKVEAEVNIRKTDGSDKGDLHHITKRGAECVMSASEDK